MLLINFDVIRFSPKRIAIRTEHNGFIYISYINISEDGTLNHDTEIHNETDLICSNNFDNILEVIEYFAGHIKLIEESE